jgi:hypothetical protein
MRWREARQSLDELLRTEKPQECALYQAFLPSMLEEKAGADLASAADPSAELWARLRESNPFSVRGSKCVLGRFMEVLRRMRSDLDHLSPQSFCYLHTCLEMDMLGGGQFGKLVVNESVLPRKSTSSRVETAEESSLRKACANQMVLATMFLLDPDTRMLERIIVTTTMPWEQWHGEQNRDLRSTSASEPWLRRQLKRDFARPLRNHLREPDAEGP